MPKKNKKLRRLRPSQHLSHNHPYAFIPPPNRNTPKTLLLLPSFPPPILAPQQQQQPPNTLGHRFSALPPELRAAIFAHLLVRPPKWSLRHETHCPLSVPRRDGRAHLNPSTQVDWRLYTCASSHASATRWRADARPVHVDSRLRSEWAPEPRNPFLCSACYAAQARPRPHPEMVRGDDVRCACARRRDLGVLLACRRWHDEAGRVFYARNTFAFGAAAECVGFLEGLRPAWRACVTKVSLLALEPVLWGPGSYEAMAGRVEIRVKGPEGFRRAWALLAKLPALRVLELDAVFLTRAECVRVLRGPALKSLARLHFTQAVMRSAERERRSTFVWPRRGVRREIEYSGFVQGVARGVKGRRYGWPGKEERERGDEKGAREEMRRYCGRFEDVTRMVRWEKGGGGGGGGGGICVSREDGDEDYLESHPFEPVWLMDSTC
ncbi:hypothetical protein F4778DRAFT_802624 [Xylariomycetidae sp. FL2044]|nr:hypothetical protein F4778DRAFT_802624 [Xylariomycetidae sp. FL2044]